MNAKHTPGPWHGYYDHAGDLMRIENGEGHPIMDLKAEVGAHDDGYKTNCLVLLFDVSSSDLALVLAAPELLGICKRLVSYAEAVRGAAGPGPLEGGLSRLIAEARTLIAQAEGGAQ